MSAHARFATFHESTRSLMILKWIIAPLLTVHIVLATISGYRAIWQIYSVDVHVSSSTLHAGDMLSFDFVSSGRVPADAEMELIQGSHRLSLATADLDANVNKSYDPRPRRGSATAIISAEQLAAFHPGPAVVRVTAYGSMQWLRTPPPVKKDVYVRIEPAR